MADKKTIKVLVVDDEKVVRDFLTRILSMQSMEAKAAEDGVKAVAAAQQEKFDLVFLDIRMPNMDGIKAYSELKKIDPGLKCIFMTGYALEESLLDKTKLPGVICLRKPFQDINQIKQAIDSVLSKSGIIGPMPAEFLERRAYARLSLILDIEYNISNIEEKIDGIYASRNIGFGGIMIVTAEDLKPGTILELKMKIHGSSKVCKAVAEVIWNKATSDKPGYFNTGLKFKKIDTNEFSRYIM